MPRQLYRNNSKSTLAVGIDTDDTVLTVAAGEGALFQTPVGGDWQMLTLVNATTGVHEIVRLTSRSGDALTVQRAQEGTGSYNWAIGTSIEGRLTAGMLDRIPTNNSTGTDAVAYGTSATANGTHGVAIGNNSSAGGNNGTAIGRQANASGVNAVALGWDAAAVTEDGIAIGRGARTRILDGTAIGAGAYAGQSSTVVGKGANSGSGSTSFPNSVAVGQNATILGSGSVAIGANATAAGANSVVISSKGTAISIPGANAVAIGNVGAFTGYGGNNSVAIGESATGAADATAVGMWAIAEGTASLALGQNAYAKSAYSASIANLPTAVEAWYWGDDEWTFRSGTGEWMGFSKDIDFTVVNSVSLPVLPPDTHFYVTEVGIIFEDVDTVTAQPSVQFGIVGAVAKHVAPVAITGITAPYQRVRFTPLTLDGETALRAEVTAAATATSMWGRFYWKGFSVFDYVP